MIRAWLERMGLGQMVRGQIVGGGFWSPFRQRTNTSELGFSNPFRADIIRRMGVKMTPRVVWSGFGYNGITVTGKNHLLDVTFGNSSPVTQVSPWYIGLHQHRRYLRMTRLPHTQAGSKQQVIRAHVKLGMMPMLLSRLKEQQLPRRLTSLPPKPFTVLWWHR
jgi:hypothetical protein